MRIPDKYEYHMVFLKSMSHPDYLNPTDPLKHLDRPMPPNLITLRSPANSITLSNPPSGASESPPNPILTLVSTVRQQLLDHESYREPYLKCLRNLYHARQGTEQQRMRKIRPTKPTDSDIRDFFLSRWPEVRLRDRGVMPLKPLDDAICGCQRLASDLVEKVTIRGSLIPLVGDAC